MYEPIFKSYHQENARALRISLIYVSKDPYYKTDMNELNQYLQQGIEIISHFNSKQQSQIRDTLPITSGENEMVLDYVQVLSENEAPLYIVGFGSGTNTIKAQGLIWKEKGKWMSQPYPKAESGLAERRKNVLQDSAYCSGFPTTARLSGDQLSVIVNMGHNGTGLAEEVHLLEKKKGEWVISWVPNYPNIQKIDNRELRYVGEGINKIISKDVGDIGERDRRQTITWVLDGEEYKRSNP